MATSAQSITIVALPSVTATSMPACQDNDLQLNATFVSGLTYTWSGPGSFSSNVYNPVRNLASNSFNGNYTVTVTDNNNCRFSATTSVTILINPYLL